MQFIKMHGAGNDYVYIDCFENQVADPVKLAMQISHRHFGVGSDGLILIKPFKYGHGEMEMYNGDGSSSEMCGNGIRCVAKYLHDTYYTGTRELKILTGRGVLTANIIETKEGKATRVQINMGHPLLDAPSIPVNLTNPKPTHTSGPIVPLLNQKLSVLDREFVFQAIGMGNPHCVIFVDNVDTFPVHVYGPLIENHPLFPRRVNVEFVEILGNRLKQRTWERGSGETWACGTGASAVAVASILLGKMQSPVTIDLLGGTLTLEYTQGSSVLMTGEAVEVFRGEWPQ